MSMFIYAMWFIIPIIALLIIVKQFTHHSFSLLEIIIQVSVTTLVIGLLFFIAGRSQTADVKFVNGVVTELAAEKQSCPWGWRSSRDNFCTEYRTRSVKVGESCSTINNVRTCTPIYTTEYNYLYDWERRYFLKSTIRRFEINRVDRQGVNTPPRYSEVVVGDPVTMKVNFTNYIKGAAASLLNEHYEEVAEIAYPRVYDYYKAKGFQ